MEIQFKLCHEVFILFKSLRLCKKIVKISDQNLTCGKKMFQNLKCCKNSDSKSDELFKVDWKSDMFWRSWFKIWRVVKNLFQNLIFLKSLDSKTGFFSIFSPNHGSWEGAKLKKLAFSRGKSIENWFSWFKVWRVVYTWFKIWLFSKFCFQKLFFIHFFSISWLFRKQITAEDGVLLGKRIQNWFSESKTFIKICSYTNQNHFKVWSVVIFVFFETWHVLKFSIRTLSTWKKLSLSLSRLKNLIQNLTRSFKNDSKTDFFSKILILKFFIKRKKLSGTILLRKSKKACFDVLTVKIDQIKDTLRSSFESQSRNRQDVRSLILKLTHCKSSDPQTDEFFKVGLN